MVADPFPLAVVTVVFDAEVEMLGLQASSFARHVLPGALGEIVVVDNTRGGLRGESRDRLVATYGVHRAAVSLLRPRDLGMGRGGSGWRRQQALKLLAARQVAAPHSVVLDAKNHLVRPLRVADVVAADGRPRLPVHGYRNHPLRRELVRVLEYAGLEPSQHLDRFTATIPPFAMRTDDVRALLDGVEARSGRPFGAELVAQGLTEFFLSTAWLLRAGGVLEDVVDPLDATSPTVWPSDLAAERVAGVVAESARNGSPFFAVHRRALVGADREALGTLTRFWVDAGLFDDVADAEDFLDRARRQIRRQMRVQKAVDLPPRALARVRRLRRRAG